MLRAEPYEDSVDIEITRKIFVGDLKTILKQNQSLIGKLGILSAIEEPITEKMLAVRKLNIDDRIIVYRKERITNQALWYSNKANYNKDKSTLWFVVTVVLHSLAII